VGVRSGLDVRSICVVGLGTIGLPTAILFANKGFHVNGYDKNPLVVQDIRAKRPAREEPELLERLVPALENGHLKVFDKPSQNDCFIISVPTLLKRDHHLNTTYLRSALEDILPFVRPHNLIILESSISPLIVDDLVVPMIKEKGFTPGVDILLAHVPERAIPGSIFREMESVERVIGGINEASSLAAADLYGHISSGHLHVTDIRTAAYVKLIENTYRDVNIALANELAILAEKVGVDGWKAIELANHHKRVHLHQPGLVGGYCIPVVPWFLIGMSPEKTRLLMTAREINDSIPMHISHLIESIITKEGIEDPKVALLGLTYKENIDDCRESPSRLICEHLRDLKIRFNVYDPHIMNKVMDEQVSEMFEALRGSDLMVVLVAHNQFSSMRPAELASLLRGRRVIDVKHCLDLESYRSSGFAVHRFGDGRLQPIRP
jgi:UDP-N-acetyl-D-mannosaminuronic acid dehydrogenase